VKALSRCRVIERKSDRAQSKNGESEPLLESIVIAIPVFPIPEDRVKDVFHVPAELMTPTRLRSQFKKAIPGRRIPSDGGRQFRKTENSIPRPCILSLFGAAPGESIPDWFEGVVYESVLVQVSANDSQIELLNECFSELR